MAPINQEGTAAVEFTRTISDDDAGPRGGDARWSRSRVANRDHGKLYRSFEVAASSEDGATQGVGGAIQPG
jgi:hypothetical protein